MTLDRNKLGYLFLVWAFFVGLVGIGLTIPMLLLIIGTILYLL